MFPKITSEKQANLLAALRLEFAPYLVRPARRFKILLRRNPRMSFFAMVFMIVTSAALAFTVMRSRMPVKSPAATVGKSVPEMGSFINSTALLSELWTLQGQIDALLSKEHLDHADSALLHVAFARLDSLRHNIQRTKAKNELNLPQNSLP